MSAHMFAFIRAINTGGRRLTNTELLEPFLAAGYGDVTAYQAAGNVAFRSDREPDAIEAELGEVLELVPDDDHVRFGGRAWFWLPRAGVSDPSLPVARLEPILGPMTMRTLGTVERMLAEFPE